jgi:hypothetical protein
MSKSCVFVSCTARAEEKRNDLLIVQSFEHGRFDLFADLDILWSNKLGLSASYNLKLEEYAVTDVEFLVFVHDDVYIDDLKILDKLRIAHRNLGYQIIGAAGATSAKISDPSLWHLMSERTHHRGFVQHFIQNGQIFGSSFGPTPSEVLVIDGLFIAVHLPSVLEKGWRFNENYQFHHYDLSSCLDAVKKGLRIGVYPIHMIHDSPGLDSCDNPSWSASNRRFLQEYGASKGEF